MKPTQKDLIDTDGENRAVRAFLLGREVGCKDYEQMRRHMTNSGFDNCWPSEFASLGGHMSKAAQQMWLRHLFDLEHFSAGGVEAVGEILNYVGDVDWISYVPLPKTKLYTHPSPTDLRAEYLRGLEDAAKVCDERANAAFPNTKQGLGFSFSQQWDATREADKNCAYAIRALKGKQ